MTARPLIAHIIHRLGIGGLENGLVNLVNGLPEERYRHAIVCLTEATDFAPFMQSEEGRAWAQARGLIEATPEP